MSQPNYNHTRIHRFNSIFEEDYRCVCHRCRIHQKRVDNRTSFLGAYTISKTAENKDGPNLIVKDYA